MHHEEHADETWLIPYADMLTLLLALFIVMFAMGQTDKEKFQEFKEQFSILFAGGSGNLPSTGTQLIPTPGQGSTMGGSGEEPGGLSDTEIEDNKMKEIKELIENEINEEGYSDKIVLILNKEGLDISIQDTVLFASGEAALIESGTPVLLSIAKALSELDNNIRVIGHTDNVPIKNGTFRSNWDLSAARAINVMHFLADNGQLAPERLSIQGNGEYSPKYDNSTAEGRAKNRRVEIMVIRKYPVSEAN